VNMNNLARMAQQMQADMARAEQELREMTVEGSAGGGVVKAVVTGKQELVSLTIDPSVVDPEDVDMLQDLIVAAIGDAMAQVRKATEEKMSRVTGGLSIPGLGM
jgi:nucleoid-associated protein EbfC